LLDGLAECLPRDKVVIEILEDAEPDDALLEKVIQLYGLGYRLALDDFTMVSDWDRFLPYIHIIKFDLRSTPQPCIEHFMANHRHLPLTYLAEKVEDQAEFERMKQLGVTLFQGFFFSRPQMVQQPTIPPAQLVVMQLLEVVNQTEPDLDKIEQLLNQDLTLSSSCCATSTTSSASPAHRLVSPGRKLPGARPAQALRRPDRRHQCGK
jgi:EAL and modified HD-GYP domain-containing signal transduction protein